MRCSIKFMSRIKTICTFFCLNLKKKQRTFSITTHTRTRKLLHSRTRIPTYTYECVCVRARLCVCVVMFAIIWNVRINALYISLNLLAWLKPTGDVYIFCRYKLIYSKQLHSRFRHQNAAFSIGLKWSSNPEIDLIPFELKLLHIKNWIFPIKFKSRKEA